MVAVAVVVDALLQNHFVEERLAQKILVDTTYQYLHLEEIL